MLFHGLILLTLIFALASSNWLLNAGTTTWLTYVMLAAIIGIIAASAYFPRFKHWLWLLFVRHKWLTATACLIIALIWQLQFVLLIHPVIGFDAGAIHNALLNPQQAELRGYFSENYNNLPLLLVLHQVSLAVHSTSWAAMALATTIVNDLAAIIILATVAIINWRKVATAEYIIAIWLGLFPMIVVPYTDVWVLLPVSAALFGWAIANRSNWHWSLRLLGGALSGLALAAGTWIKPSAAVIGIAFILVWLVFLLKADKRTWFSLVAILAMSAAFGLGYQQMQQVSSRQDYIQIDPSRRIPMIHFINVGMSHDGAYDPKAALKMAELPTKQARINYSKRQIRHRLEKRGPWGYLKFLVAKQGLNTASGTFGWLHEGHFIRSARPHHGWRGFLASLVYPRGTYLAEFQFMAQLAWTTLIIIIAFGWESGGLTAQTLRLGIIGGMLFLLIFEGGRSRYLIQYLPLFLTLATLTADNAYKRLKIIFRAVFGHTASLEGKHD